MADYVSFVFYYRNSLNDSFHHIPALVAFSIFGLNSSANYLQFCKMQKHYNIPIFMPEIACPFRCVFCNQEAISACRQLPDIESAEAIIIRNLQSIPPDNAHIEIAFFGGNFTGLAANDQLRFLNLAQSYVKSGAIKGIRISTRPDYINQEVLSRLADYGVSSIELGAQSMDDEVLKASGRGHTAGCVRTAADAILKNGFRLGLQMMIGLPADNEEKSMKTAREIISTGAHETRIYPCLVIENTALERSYRAGNYQPLLLEEAVALSARLGLLFEQYSVRVIRYGLHRSESLNAGAYIAGPYHPSFKELVMTHIWSNIFKEYLMWPSADSIEIRTTPSEINYAAGYKGMNRKWLQQKFRKLRFVADHQLSGRSFIIQPLLHDYNC